MLFFNSGTKTGENESISRYVHYFTRQNCKVTLFGRFFICLPQLNIVALQIKFELQIMKKVLLSFLFCGIGVLSLVAQITVTSATFPSAGDTLRTSIDAAPSGISISAPGVDQTWDFSTLAESFPQEVIMSDASEGAAYDQFPGSDLVVLNGVSETYYNKTSTVFEVLGYKGPDPGGLGLDVAAHLNPAELQRRAPMHFFDLNSTSSALLLPFSTASLPDTLTSQLPGGVDSLRIRYATDRTDLVDAWGKLTIPGGTFDVLRERRFQVSETRLDVKLPFLGWQDVTDLVQLGFLGKDTTLTYNYFNDVSKEPIAVVTTNNTGDAVTRVVYKKLDLTSDIGGPEGSGLPDCRVYPNPAVDDVRFEMSNLPAGTYTLKIYNILGSEVWRQQYPIVNNKTIRVNLSNLRKGTYLFSLVSDKGKTVTTKRLIIIRP